MVATYGVVGLATTLRTHGMRASQTYVTKLARHAMQKKKKELARHIWPSTDPIRYIYRSLDFVV